MSCDELYVGNAFVGGESSERASFDTSDEIAPSLLLAEHYMTANDCRKS